MMKKALILIALVGTLWGCDNAIESAYKEQIVVGAFLYAGEQTGWIVLHRTTPFGSYFDDLDYAVDSATVTLTVDGVAHVLKPGDVKGRYYLPASELIVQGGKTYQLSVVAPNHQTGGVHTLSASTTVPMPIHLDPIADSIRGKTFVYDTTDLSHFAFILTAGPVDQPNRKYLLSVTALDTSYGRVRHRETENDSIRRTRYSFVQTGPAIAVLEQFIGWYGPTLFTFNAIDTNWSDYQRQVPPFGNTNYEPSLNHISGGMGVFASGARDTVSVFLKPKD
jgi:hypothetical protein